MTAQAQPTTKAELLESIRCQRGLLEDAVGDLRPEQMTAAGVIEDWSVKDLLAHIAAWEQRMVKWVGQYLVGDAPDLPGGWDDIHRLNAETYEESRDRPLHDVLEAFHTSYSKALRVAEQTPESALFDRERFPDRDGSPLWILIAANTVWHYQEHREQIVTWLEQREGSIL